MISQEFMVYHHCLFGIRYDFLCANYTAFDQTLFNCNFVSNVDCQNSKKFWHRNDDLYKTESTTTLAPVVYNFYTPSPETYALASPRVRGRLGSQPQIQKIQIVPQVATQIQQTPQIAGQITPPPQASVIISELSAEPRRRQRPPARRRPAYDYYDDEYEELPRRTRPRRPRPLYYDYDEYEDERYDRRGGNRRRRPYDRMRPQRRDKERRRKYEYYDDEEEEDYDESASDKKTMNRRRKYENDYEDDTRRGRPTSRRAESSSERPSKKARRPSQDELEYDGKRRKSSEENKKPSRLGVRRPPSEDYEDDLQEADNEKNGRTDKENKNSSEETKALIKPVSGTLYDRPRPAPKINRPVPKNAVDKFSYKPVTTPTQADEYISDEYEDKLTNESQQSSPTNIDEIQDEEYSEAPSRLYNRRKLDSNGAEVPRLIFKRPIKVDDPKPSSEKSTSAPTTTTEPVTIIEMIADKFRPIMRKFKRPAPGNRPFSSRNLQSSNNTNSEENDSLKPDAEIENLESGLSKFNDTKVNKFTVDKAAVTTAKNKSSLTVDVSSSKSGPMRVKVPIRVNNYIKSTEPTKLETLYENYDVTLNEASPIVDAVGKKFPTGLDRDSDFGRYYRASKL